MAAILVVDDDPEACDLIKDILSVYGHEVTLAENGVQALDRLKAFSFDLMICDIIMPEKEGLETIREVRTMTSNLKIIAISGGSHYSRRDYLNFAELFGADAALQKPFKSKTLLEAVNNLLA